MNLIYYYEPFVNYCNTFNYTYYLERRWFCSKLHIQYKQSQIVITNYYTSNYYTIESNTTIKKWGVNLLLYDNNDIGNLFDTIVKICR